MPKSQPQKAALKRRRSTAVGILLSGLGRIAAELHSYGRTLLDEPSKPWPDVFPTLLPHHLSDSIVLPASQVHVDCLFILEIVFTQVILGKQRRGSTSFSKTFATVSQPILFCTGELFGLIAKLAYFTPRFTGIYCEAMFSAIPFNHSSCRDGTNVIATRKSDFSGALHIH